MVHPRRRLEARDKRQSHGSPWPIATRLPVFAGTQTLEFVCSAGSRRLRREKVRPSSRGPRRTLPDWTVARFVARALQSRRQGGRAVVFIRARTASEGSSRRQPENKRAGPGRVRYNHLSELSTATAPFGSSKRAEYDHQYVGPGMPTPADSRCQASYVGNGSMLGSQISRPSSPAFSFGKKSSTVPRRAAEPRPMTTPSGLGSTFTDEGADRPTSMSGQRRKTVKYDWLRGGSKQQTQKNTYQRAVDGADMPRANEFSKQPSVCVWQGRAVLRPHLHPSQTRGSLRDNTGTDLRASRGLGQAPSHRFPKSRTARIQTRGAPRRRSGRARRVQPALEHRVESLLSEAESSMMMDTNSLGHTAMAPDDIVEGAASRRTR